MKTTAKLALAGLLVAVAVAVYPSVRTSYVRHQAEAHLREADELRGQASSPVARQALADSSSRLTFVLMQSDASSDAIRESDAALVEVIERTKSAPPPDHPVRITATYPATVRAGEVLSVSASIAPAIEEIYLVSVTAVLEGDTGWKSESVRRAFNQPFSGAPIAASIDVPIPPSAAGPARLVLSAAYRLGVTGEGGDLIDRPADRLPVVTIQAPQ